jgi:hypothetical protein
MNYLSDCVLNDYIPICHVGVTSVGFRRGAVRPPKIHRVGCGVKRTVSSSKREWMFIQSACWIYRNYNNAIFCRVSIRLFVFVEFMIVKTKR